MSNIFAFASKHKVHLKLMECYLFLQRDSIEFKDVTAVCQLMKFYKTWFGFQKHLIQSYFCNYKVFESRI